MNKIDTSNWKEYKITDFFESLPISEKLTKKELLDTGKYEVHSSELYKNGIQGYTNRQASFKINKDCSFYVVFGDQNRSINIVKNDFCVLDNVKVLKPKKINELIARFILVVWQKSIPNLGYARHWSFAEKISIKLPITPKAEPDWHYMEDYMKNIENKVNKVLNGFQNAKCNKNRIDIKKWAFFNIIDLFNISNTHSILKSNVEFGSGNIPYVTASYENNSVTSYILANKDIMDKGNSILIGGKTMAITYQEKDFVSNDSHNLLLELKFSEYRKKYEQLFLVGALKNSFGNKYKWTDSISKKTIRFDKILLPIDKNNKPDWQYMENYMKNIEIKAKNNLDKLHLCTL